MLTCPVKSAWGIPCPGCGMQRSIMALTEGDLLLSIRYYPALLPLALLAVYTLLHLKFSYKNGARNIVILFSFSVALTLVSYIMTLGGVWFIK